MNAHLELYKNTSENKWSPATENKFKDTRTKLLAQMTKAGAKPTDVLYPDYLQSLQPAKGTPWEIAHQNDQPNPIEYMPHLRALTGLLMHLEGVYGRKVEKSELKKLEFLLEKNQVKNILDAGGGGSSALAWLAKTGIPKKLGIKLYNIDSRKNIEESALQAAAELGIEHATGDIREASEKFGTKFDLIISTGTLSPGGYADYVYQTNQKEPEKTNRALNLPAASIHTHALAKAMVEMLSDNPAAAVVATSWFGSLALRKEKLEKFASVKLWQTTGATRESDVKRIDNYLGIIAAKKDPANGNADYTNRMKKAINYGRKLLAGAQLTVFTKQDTEPTT